MKIPIGNQLLQVKEQNGMLQQHFGAGEKGMV
jgi:hypothetical protein